MPKKLIKKIKIAVKSENTNIETSQKNTSEHKEPVMLVGGENLRQSVFGFEDGLVNVLGIVTGVAAASATSYYVILAGMAGAIANSVSMAAGTYLSIKSQQEFYNMQIEREKKEIEEVPEVEKEEVREIYRKKGFEGKELDMITQRITSDKKVWLDVMMKEELGLGEGHFENPVKASIVMILAVVLGSIFPIVPFFLMPPMPALIISLILSGIVLFAAGALKGALISQNWFISGLEMLIVASLAAGASWVIGSTLGGILPLV